MSVENNNTDSGENLFSILISKFLPFWPLFVGLFVIGLITASIYLQFTTPLYESSAAIIVNDEKKGVDESQIMESMNVFESKKIVENEIEVLRSKNIIGRVVNDLGLYAPVYASKFFKDRSAFSDSPIQVRLKDPNDPRSYQNAEIVDFTYDAKTNSVIIEDISFPLDTWSKNPYGGSDIKFIENLGAPRIAKNNYYYQLQNPKVVTKQLLNGLFVGAASKLSTVVRINYLDAAPDRGNAIVDGIISSYQKASIADQNSLAANTLDFVEKRMEQVGKDLNSVEKELEKYRSSEGVINLSEQGNLYLQNVGDYDRRIADIDLQLSVLNKVESYVLSKNKTSGIVPSTLGIGDPILSQLLQRLYDAEIEYEQLRKTTAENNPILVSITNRIEKIRPGILENVRSQKSNLIASRSSLSTNSGKYNDALEILPEQERKYVEITRKKKSISDLYDFLVQKREETALSYAPTAGNVRVIESAEASVGPVSPKKLFIYAVILFLFLAMGLAWVVGKELLNSKILFRSELESRTDIPVLGELAFVDRPQEDLLITKHNDIFIADQFRQILSYLGTYDFQKSVQTIMVSSSIAGEGKSYVSANLAISVALSGKKTALVDMDLRKSGVSEIFGLKNKPGISDYLSSTASLQNISFKKENDLDVFPAGKKALNSSELLARQTLADFFSKLKEEYEVIIVDSPPTSLVSDATILGSFCDKTLMTVRHNHTPKFTAKRLDENVSKKRLPNCSLVFNGVKARGIIKQNYGYGYGYGYETASDLKNETLADVLIEKINDFKRFLGVIKKYIAKQKN